MDRIATGSSPLVTKVSQIIGATPLLELVCAPNGSRVLLKLEQFNPTGSAKIRMAKQMIEDAEAAGRLKPGGWIVESTSGNTGMGLALIAAERGYRFTAVVDNHSSKEKLRVMRALGAQFAYVGDSCSGQLATAERDALAGKLAEEQDACWTEQHNNPANPQGYAALAQELLDVLGDSITHCIGAVGTGGSLFGTGRVLRERIANVQIIGVEPLGSVIFGGPGGAYYQSGTGTPPGAEIGKLIDYELLDEGVTVTDRQAFNTARYLARHRGLLVGGSAGGVIYHALQKLMDTPPGSVLVALVCDGGEKYLDTVFDDDWMNARDLLDPDVDRELATLLPSTRINKERR